jgi:long-chain acyl-CoA synthetase
MGIKKMIKSPLFHQNRTEWNIMDIGILQTERKTPIYPTITEDDYEYILNHSEQYIVLYLTEILQK